MLVDCLKGYKNLFGFCGGLNVGADMIGVNLGGKAKVWVNSNFVHNCVEDGGFSKFEQKKSQKQMVTQVFELLAKRIKQKEQPEFRKIFEKLPNTFEEAIDCCCGYMFSRRGQASDHQPSTHRFGPIKQTP